MGSVGSRLVPVFLRVTGAGGSRSLTLMRRTCISPNALCVHVLSGHLGGFVMTSW
jgi:hypothetical protein